MTIHFGTDGWRALIADDYTFENVRRVSHATAQFWKSEKRKKLDCYSWKPGAYECAYRPAESGMIVAYDARFLSEQFADAAASVLAGHGIPVYLSDAISPTPAVSLAIRERNLSGGVMITASHNPYTYNGFKIKMEFAGSSLPEITRGVEEALKEAGKEMHPRHKISVEKAEIVEPYLDEIKQKVDIPLIEKARFQIVADPLYGTNVGLLKHLLPKAHVEEIHAARNPLFPGVNPEPIEPNLKELMQLVSLRRASVGLSFDGDGDRIGAVDEQGNFLSSHEIFSLLLWHLARNKKWSGAVAKTFSTTNRLKLLADYFRLPYYETPIGFKHICKLFLTQDILIGGEESGGIGMKNHIPERDALLNALMLLELMAVTGKKLGEILNEIHQTIGYFYTDRVDLHLTPGKKEALLGSLAKEVPDKIEGVKVEGVSTLDGVKYLLEGHAWLLFRPSGTEPLIRVYAEAGSTELVKRLLQRGKERVEGVERHAAAIKG